MRIALACLTVSILIAPTAQAEVRTPQSAQQFLAETFARAPVPLQRRGGGMLWETEPALAPTALSSTDVCETANSVAADARPRSWNWATLGPVERRDDRIYFNDRVRLQFADEETASRVAVAMEFLRTACTGESETGF